MDGCTMVDGGRTVPRGAVRGAALMFTILLGCGGAGGRAGADGSRPAADSSVADGAVASDGGTRDTGAPPTDSSTPVDSATLDSATPDSASPSDSGTSPPSDGGTLRDAAAPSADFCQLRCVTSADCTTPSAAFDADNYDCAAGVCRYTGCNDDAECASTFASADYVCRSVAGLNTCVKRCTTRSDCASGSAAFDADNYLCESSRCVYTGCNDDAECASTYSDSRYVCRAVTPATGLVPREAVMNCVLRCSVASDCSTPSAAFDADNYECRGGACHYAGCNSDTECASSFSDSRYICR